MREKKLDLEEVKEIVGSHIVWIKFGKDEHLKDLQKGNLYMNNLDYYINLEKETDDETVGDKYEGALLLKDLKIRIYEIGTDKLVAEGTSKESEVNMISKKYTVFCFCCLNNDNMVSYNFFPDKKLLQVRYEFSKEQLKEFKEFGNSAIVITDPQLFIDKITTTINNAQIVHRKVKYYQDNQKDYVEEIAENPIMSAFWKREKYKYQSEYRIMVRQENQGPLKINIGDISEITKILSSDTVLSCYIEINYNLEELKVKNA